MAAEYTDCAFNAAPRGANFADHCGQPITVILREERGERFRKLTGQSFTEHGSCADCARVMLGSPRFTVARYAASIAA